MKNILNFAKNLSIIFALSFLVFSVNSFAAPKLSPPTLGVGSVGTDYIDITVTAGSPNGAPAGFSLQWMIYSDFLANGWDGDSSRVCKASFSGNASGYNYNLAAGQMVTIRVGNFDLSIPGGSTECPDVLDCDTTYIFRSFAHNVPGKNGGFAKSDWYYLPGTVTTLPCNVTQGCTYTQGYWKTHGPVPKGHNSNEWDVAGLNLGIPYYDQFQLQAIFDTSVGGNGLISLSHQLIAAKLNVANGANPTALGTAITDADNLIGSQVVPPIGGGYLPTATTSVLNDFLTNFNEGKLAGGPPHCN